MKKRTKVILALCTALNLLLLACAGWLFYLAREKAVWSPPIQASVPASGDVGYLRISPDVPVPSYLYRPAPDYVKYEFLERIPNMGPEGQAIKGDPGSQSDIVRIKRTVSDSVPESKINDSRASAYQRVAWYCQEDGYWYAVYYPNYLIPAGFSPLVPGEQVLECFVPSDVLARPGRYKLEFSDLGCCEFEIP